jgi:hypothetical protein
MPATAWTSATRAIRVGPRAPAISDPRSSSERQPSRTVRSSARRRAGSARLSISPILPRATVKPITANGCPCAPRRIRGPFTSTGCANRASRAKPGSICRAAGTPHPGAADERHRTARAWTWTSPGLWRAAPMQATARPAASLDRHPLPLSREVCCTKCLLSGWFWTIRACRRTSLSAIASRCC